MRWTPAPPEDELVTVVVEVTAALADGVAAELEAGAAVVLLLLPQPATSPTAASRTAAVDRLRGVGVIPR